MAPTPQITPAYPHTSLLLILDANSLGPLVGGNRYSHQVKGFRPLSYTLKQPIINSLANEQPYHVGSQYRRMGEITGNRHPVIAYLLRDIAG